MCLKEYSKMRYKSAQGNSRKNKSWTSSCSVGSASYSTVRQRLLGGNRRNQKKAKYLPRLDVAPERPLFWYETDEKFYYIFNKFIDKLDFIVLESFIFSILVSPAVVDRARWSLGENDYF